MRSIWIGSASGIVLLAAQGAYAQQSPQTSGGMETIVVTAEKRAEPLDKVPGSVSALEGTQLSQLGASSVNDFAALVPGLTTSGGGNGGGNLVIRGIGTGGLAPSSAVGVLVDGVPVGSSSGFADGGLTSLDSSLWDVDRVEVLRGPQGTLYGASGMTGLLSYVYRAPSLTDYDVRGEATVSDTENGSANYAVRGAVNVPIIQDQLGLRIAASHEDDGGYIDYFNVGKDNANRDIADNVRASLLWQPNGDLSIKLTGDYQRNMRQASDYVMFDRTTNRPAFGDLQNSQLRDPATFNYIEAAATIDYNLGWGDLTSISAWQRTESHLNPDYSDTGLGTSLAGLGATYSTVNLVPSTKKFTQEVRLTSTDDGPFKYLAGFFYSNEQGLNSQLIQALAADETPLPGLNPILTVSEPSRYQEYAFYAQASYDLTSRLEITGGIRYSHDDQRYHDTNGGVLASSVPNVPETSSSEDEENYLATLRYALSDTSNLYAKAASGYRPGGPDPSVPGSPPSFGPDKLWNYEGGYKGSLFDGKADIQADVFYITWSNIQVLGATPSGFDFTTNGKGAVSQGVELQGSVMPFDGMTIGGTVAYTDAHLSDPAPAVGGTDGERLPDSPKWSGALTADYRWPVWDGWNAFVGGTLRVVGNKTTSFDASTTAPQYRLPSYSSVDLRVGLDADNWRITAYVRNVGDDRSELSANTSFTTATNFALVQIARPRTYGLQLDYHL